MNKFQVYSIPIFVGVIVGFETLSLFLGAASWIAIMFLAALIKEN